MKNWIGKLLTPSIPRPEDGLTYWREKIFLNVLFIFSVFGLVAYAFGCYQAIVRHTYMVIIGNTIGYLIVLLSFFLKNINTTFRYNTMTILTLFIGINLLVWLGPNGNGFIYLIGFSLLSSLLFGLNGAINSLTIIFSLVIIVGVSIPMGWLDGLSIGTFDPMFWYARGFTVLVICAISSIPLTILVDGLGRTIQAQNSLQGVLEQKITELEAANEKAIESDSLKTMFLANMSHEVRTPLNAILGYSELIHHEMYTSIEEQKKYLKVINQKGEYLLQLIDDILDFSMIESQQFPHQIRPLSLFDLFEELQSLYCSRLVHQNGVEIVFDMPSKAIAPVVNTDRQRIKQVFINLINNALKFTNEGEITIGYQVEDKRLVCFVKDTGIGIPGDKQEFVFNRFVKIDDKTRLRDGTGLGLPIAKGIVGALGGEMWLESEINKGSTFFFSLVR